VLLSVVNEFLSANNLHNACIDSRQVRPGDVFFAVQGRVTDGRQYIQQAIDNGAIAVIADGEVAENYAVPVFTVHNLSEHLGALSSLFYSNPSHNLKVIAITGTNGKTSTSHYVAQLLAAQSFACGVMGTLGNGVYPNLQESQLTTSDCCTIQKQLREYVVANAQYVAMEASSGGLDQGRLNGTLIDTAVFTNLSQDHLDYHSDMEDYFAAKCRLFTDFAVKHCIINIDDPYGKRLVALIQEPAQLITYSLLDKTADVYFDGKLVHTPWGSGELISKLIGKFNISNILAALASCAVQGIALEKLLADIKNVHAVTGRMQLINQVADEPQVIVDYAHTPDALDKVLQTLRENSPSKIYCIFGCGGDRDPKKRPLMLRAVLDNSDEIIITRDNPRTEDAHKIVQDMLAGNEVGDNVTIELDRAQAILQTIARAQASEVVLIAGKGHEDYQIIGTTKHKFSDQEVAQQALELRRKQE
jgi:UDP-N-acetylmuramoyl-L-alanyl-D-glutamate--2,6-diaminopimelate ligase